MFKDKIRPQQFRSYTLILNIKRQKIKDTRNEHQRAETGIEKATTSITESHISLKIEASTKTNKTCTDRNEQSSIKATRESSK